MFALNRSQASTVWGPRLPIKLQNRRLRWLAVVSGVLALLLLYMSVSADQKSRLWRIFLHQQEEEQGRSTPAPTTINRELADTSRWIFPKEAAPALDNLVAVLPSPEAIRIASLDRHRRFFFQIQPNTQNDLFSRPKFFVKEELIMASNNPQPIWMLKSDASLGQIYYQRTHGEAMTRKVFRNILGSSNFGCSQYPNDGFVLDLGANEGFYGLLASAYGCRAISIEAQPLCVAMLDFAVAMNTFKHPLKVLHRVGTGPSSVAFDVDPWTCSGIQEYHEGMTKKRQSVEVKSVDVNVVIAANGGHVLLWHMDIEGAEINILEATFETLKRGKIMNIVFETSGQRWEKYGVSLEKGVQVLENVRKLGYRCRSIKSHGQRNPAQAVPVFPSFVGLPGLLTGDLDIWCTLMPEFFDEVPNQPDAENDQTISGFVREQPGF